MQNLLNKIFNINSYNEFEQIALKIFNFQAKNNPIYSEYIKYLNIKIHKVKKLTQIPFLPIEFFKTKKIVTKYYDLPNQKFTKFKSSGTSQSLRSTHYIYNLSLYEKSFIKTFNNFFGNPSDYVILALLPSYIQAGDSSLVYMINKLIKLSDKPESGFYLNDLTKLSEKIKYLDKKETKVMLFGVTYALLQLAEKSSFNLKNTIIIETGGMKGRGKEIIREELHNRLKKAFNTNKIYSEYGMTELLSQAYLLDSELFIPAKTMKILIRDINDPFFYLPANQTGGINVIDLANFFSCSFIETKDLGKLKYNGFLILGRFDNSDLRGCNLLTY